MKKEEKDEFIEKFSNVINQDIRMVKFNRHPAYRSETSKPNIITDNSISAQEAIIDYISKKQSESFSEGVLFVVDKLQSLMTAIRIDQAQNNVDK